MKIRNRRRGPFVVRVLAAWTLALYAASTIGHLAPALALAESFDESPMVMSGPVCCPLWCSSAGPAHQAPTQIPSDCDLCKQIVPVCVAVLATQLGALDYPAPGSLPGHLASGYAAAWRGPASPRDPPVPS